MLKFPRNEIVEIVPASYQNSATSIVIPECSEEHIPDSPEDIQIPVPPSIPNSGKITPMDSVTPRTRGCSPSKNNMHTTNPRRGMSPPSEQGDGAGSLLLVDRALGRL